MSASLKRNAEHQLIPDEKSQERLDSGGALNDGWKEADAQELATRKFVFAKSSNGISKDTPIDPSQNGFLAYASKNPFIAALGSTPSLYTSSEGFGSSENTKGFGSFAAAASNSNPFGLETASAVAKPILNPKNLTVQTKSVSAEENSSIFTPSPKTEKINPFSSASPALNPFVKIVDSKDEPWLERTTSQTSSSSSSKPSQPMAAKSFFSSYKRSPPAPSAWSAFSTADDKLSRDEKPAAIEDDGDNDEEEGNDNVEEEVQTGPIGKVYHLPENVVIVTGEEDEENLLQIRVKLFRWVKNEVSSSADDDSKAPDGSWVEVGVGPIKLLQEKPTGDGQDDDSSIYRKMRIVMRREDRKGGHGTKLLLNVPLRSYVTIRKHSDKALRLTCIHSDSENTTPSPQTYLIKTKFSQECETAFNVITDGLDKAKTANY